MGSRTKKGDCWVGRTEKGYFLGRYREWRLLGRSYREGRLLGRYREWRLVGRSYREGRLLGRYREWRLMGRSYREGNGWVGRKRNGDCWVGCEGLEIGG